MSSPGDELAVESIVDSRVSRQAVIAACFAAATVGALVNASSSALAVHRLAGMNRPGGSDIGLFGYLSGSAAVATVIGLVVLRLAAHRGWPWLLVAGTVLGMPATLTEIDPTMFTEDLPLELVYVTGGASPALVTIGLLGAATLLCRNGFPPIGGALAGAVAGVAWLGLTVFVHAFTGTGGSLDTLHTVLAAVSLAGATGAVVINRALPRATVGQPPTWLVVAAASVAAALPVVLDLVLRQSDQVVTIGVAGVALLVVAVSLAATAGSRAVVGTAAVALINVGLFTPFALAAGGMRGHLDLMWVFALVGLLLGCAAGLNRWRAWYGAGACALLSLILLAFTVGVSTPPSDGDPYLPYAVLLSLAVFAVTASVATTGAALGPRSVAAPVIGAFAVTAQVGTAYALNLTQIGQTGEATVFNGGEATLIAGALLLVACVLVMGVGSGTEPSTVDDDEEPAGLPVNSAN
ncbi:hypothetical protein EV193_102292 [Herbihabitans rhizosphaerae]|uniref:MFS transporter n=1 Tax=Herbihabitans rhizosphaerae TaxID=1872711 RepID=A0A4V2EU47_9PSEU|nr:hypothetical protein [Herbihabitans rhizosphaerae]RZS43313.1 hypothetical protein EV193_102292 [Herbihabitans rhizosphaerae]